VYTWGSSSPNAGGLLHVDYTDGTSADYQYGNSTYTVHDIDGLLFGLIAPAVSLCGGLPTLVSLIAEGPSRRQS
jgi:hypothetical protein